MPDLNNDLILITCASGKQSTTLLPHILKTYKNIRLQCNSPSSFTSLSTTYSDNPNISIVQADMYNQADCTRMLENVTTCFLVDPPFHPHETQLGKNVIDACVAQKSPGGCFEHLVYTSVIFPHLSKLLNHDCKRLTEEYLIESGLNYTILQPTHMMEMLPLANLLRQDEPVYVANWNADTKFSFVTTVDIGEAAAKVLTEGSKHYFATYQLVSTEHALSYTQVADIVSGVIEKKVRVQQRSFEEAVDVAIKMINGGKEPPAATKEIGARMFLYYNERGLIGNRNVLGWLLGREPTGYEEWVRMKVDEIKKDQKA